MDDKKNQQEEMYLFADLTANPNGSLVPEEIPEELLGAVYYGTGKTERAAMDEADDLACAHAKERRTCFHPSRMYKRTEKDGVWTAYAIAANHRGSCPRFPPPQRHLYCWSWEY